MPGDQSPSAARTQPPRYVPMPTLSHPAAALPVAKDTALSDPRPWTPSNEVAVGTPVPPPALLAHRAVGGAYVELRMRHEPSPEPEPMDHLEPLVECAPSPEPDQLEPDTRHKPSSELEVGMRQESSQEPHQLEVASEDKSSLEPDHQEPEPRREPSPEPANLQTDMKQESSPEPAQLDEASLKATSSIASSYLGDDSGVSCDGVTPGVTPVHTRHKVELESATEEDS